MLPPIAAESRPMGTPGRRSASAEPVAQHSAEKYLSLPPRVSGEGTAQM